MEVRVLLSRLKISWFESSFLDCPRGGTGIRGGLRNRSLWVRLLPRVLCIVISKNLISANEKQSGVGTIHITQPFPCLFGVRNIDIL